MGIKYINLSVAIHGVDAASDGVGFLIGWLREAVRAGLTGHSRELFKFRDEFDSDIEVEVIETAGEPRYAAMYLADKEEVILDAQRWRWLREQGGWPDTEYAASNQAPEWFDRLADKGLSLQPNKQ